MDTNPKFRLVLNFAFEPKKKMAQLKSLQRRLTSTVVLGAEVREREAREAMLEEEKVRMEAKRSGIKSWWRRMVCRQTLLVEVAFAGREVVDNKAEARFRWRKRVVTGGGQRLEKVMEEVKRSPRDSFEEEVAEVFTVQEAEEVFPDDFEDHLLDNNDTKRDESDINNSAFNITTFCSSSFTSIDSSYQHFKRNLRQSLRPSSSLRMKEEVEEQEETYESFEAVDGNVEQLLTKNYGRSRLRGQ